MERDDFLAVEVMLVFPTQLFFYAEGIQRINLSLLGCYQLAHKVWTCLVIVVHHFLPAYTEPIPMV